jgi:hypothetical protein
MLTGLKNLHVFLCVIAYTTILHAAVYLKEIWSCAYLTNMVLLRKLNEG